MSPERFVLVGGGLTGCALALALAKRGAKVLVLERAVPGAEASSAAAGILGPRMEAHGQEPLRGMGVESLAMYPAWVAELEAASGLAVNLRRTGLVRVVLPGEDVPAIDADAQWLEGAALRAVDPCVAPDAVGAWWLPDEACLEPAVLVRAAHVAAEKAGARFRTGVAVRSARPEAVTLVDGTVERGRVVVCAGAWTGTVPGLEGVPVRPVRGQLAELLGAGGPGPVAFGAGGYCVPRGDGRVIVGSTVEDVGFVRGVTAEGLVSVLDRAIRLYPALAAATVERTWSGFRPGTPDLLPVLGEVGGVMVASGHYRNGILLAPLTARWLADALLDGAPLPPSVSPGRFASAPAEEDA